MDPLDSSDPWDEVEDPCRGRTGAGAYLPLAAAAAAAAVVVVVVVVGAGACLGSDSDPDSGSGSGCLDSGPDRLVPGAFREAFYYLPSSENIHTRAAMDE